jgi:hypothetical protein
MLPVALLSGAHGRVQVQITALAKHFDVAESDPTDQPTDYCNQKVKPRERGCEQAWNKDPVFGVIGIQSGPRG